MMNDNRLLLILTLPPIITWIFMLAKKHRSISAALKAKAVFKAENEEKIENYYGQNGVKRVKTINIEYTARLLALWLFVFTPVILMISSICMNDSLLEYGCACVSITIFLAAICTTIHNEADTELMKLVKYVQDSKV